MSVTKIPSSHEKADDVDISVADGKALVLRSTRIDGTSHGGFQWPTKVGERVAAPDWRDCGYLGDTDDLWWLVEVDRAACRDLGGGVKFQPSTVRAYGSMADMMSAIGRYQIGLLINAATSESGDWSRHASSGDWSQHASSGDRSRHASSGVASRHASSGDWSRHASSGDWSQHASSGVGSQHASSGAGAVVACAGLDSIVELGEGGCCAIPYNNGKRIRFAIGYVGENIKAGVSYRVNSDGEFVETEK